MLNRNRITIFISILMLVALIFGARLFFHNLPTTTLTIGMPMTTAVSEMSNRGLTPGQLAASGPHQAFDLPDGRTVVLIGDNSVDAIEVILNPEKPKANRATLSVRAITF